MFDQDEAIRRRTGGAYGNGKVRLPEQDVRHKRTPVLMFLLKRETLRRFLRIAILLAMDFAGVVGALLTASVVKLMLEDQLNLHQAWGYIRPWITFSYMVTVLMFARADLYSDRPRRQGLARIATALFQVTVIALVFALANGEHFLSYYIFYGSLFFGIVYITAVRFMFMRISGRVLERAGYRRRALVIGSGRHLTTVAAALVGEPGPVDLVGYIAGGQEAEREMRWLGQLDQLPDILNQEFVEDLVIADPDFPEERALDLVESCHLRGITVHVAPSTLEILLDRAEFTPGESVPLFTLRPPVFEGVAFAVKRTFDLIISSLTLLALSPILICIAIAVKLSSRGPVIYRSVRPGIGGRPFHCLKFRTMRTDAEDAQAELEGLNESTGALFKIRDDPRMTAVGRALRRYSLDELPQLVNVVRGEMSLVGPRPLPMRDFERLQEWHKKRYLVLPGITGLWQVSGRSELDFDDLVRLDFLYLERWSIFLDLSILLKTIPAVLTRRGAF